MNPSKIVGRTGLYFAVVVLAVYSAFPIYWMIASSVRPTQEMLLNPTLIPTRLTFDYYYSLLAQTDYPRQFLNSLIVALATVALTMVLSIMIAYGVTRQRIRGKQLIIGGMLYAYMFPPLLLAIPLYAMFTRIGLNDTLLSLVISHLTITMPLGVWFLWGFFKTMPFELEEAAMVDGCTRLGAFLRVVLPLSVPGAGHGGDLRVPAVVDGLHLRPCHDRLGRQQDGAARSRLHGGRVRFAVGGHHGGLDADRPSAVCCVRDAVAVLRAGSDGRRGEGVRR